MYKIEKTIDNVNGIKCIDNVCYYNIDSILYLNDKEIISGVEGNSFWILSDNNIYFHNEDGDRIYLDNQNAYKINFPFFIETKKNDRVFCKINFRREKRKWNWELGLFDLNEGKLADSFQISNFTIEISTELNIIGYYQKDKLIALDINNLNINNWEFYLEDKEIIKKIGTWNNQLILACSNHLLVSIDTNTGNVIQQWQELPDFDAGLEYKNVLPEPEDFVLDKEVGKLIGVFSKYYFEIDLTTGAISYEDIREELLSHNINSFRRMGDNQFTKDHLFLTAHADLAERPNVDLDCVLALNRHTHKVDWVHIFKDTEIGTNVPQITENYLYQLDTENTLHIFEKE